MVSMITSITSGKNHHRYGRFDRHISGRCTEETVSCRPKRFATERIPGVATVYAGYSIWQELSKRKMKDVSDEEYDRLFDAVKKTLRMMAEQGGRILRRICWQPGGYVTYKQEYGIPPCVKCGYELHKENYGRYNLLLKTARNNL